MNKSATIWLITNLPTPYRIPLFNELGRKLSERGYALKVIFGALGEPRRKWNINTDEFEFDWQVLEGKGIKYRNSESLSFTYPGLLRQLREEKPALVITNGFSPATAKLWMKSLVSPLKYIIWSGDTGYPRQSFPGKVYRKLLTAGASAYITYGTLAKDYLASLGADPDSVYIAINTVDTEFFASHADAPEGDPQVDSRSRLLCIGDLSARKRPDRLVHAIKSLSKKRRDFILEFVGDGPEKDSLLTLADKQGVADLITFSGYLQRPETAASLARARCFLFPTGHDVWGLVLVEAMAAGKVCISSVYAGATHDLIEDGVTGFTSDFSDPDEVADRLDWILDNYDQASQIGANARKYIEKNVSVSVSAQGMIDAISHVLE
jgi:glycosyltransferase involved in cell wall biosynthesis